MNSWQRRARVVLAIFVVAFATALFFALRREPAKPPAQPVARADPNAAVESTGGVAVQLKGNKEEFKIESAESLVYANGLRRLKGVKVTVAKRAGRTFVLTADQGEVGEGESALEVAGRVVLTSSDGLTLTTDRASYTDSDGIVRAPGPVQFRRGRLSGSGVGMTYDKNRDVLWLLDQAEVEIGPDEKGAGATRVHTAAAGFARQDHYLRFERGVRVLRAGRSLEADSGVAWMSEDDSRIERVELRGGSRIVGGTGQPGALEAMSARDMDLTYGAQGEILQQALLAGGAVIRISGEKGTRGRRIAGEWVDVGLGPDGTTVVSLQARDNVRLDLPAEKTAPARTVRAVSLQASGTAETGLTTAAFQSDPGNAASTVEFREQPAGNAQPRVAHARTMGLALKPGFGEIESARFGGGVRFEDGDLTATAREARYVIATGQLNITGDDERTGRPPQVVDAQTAISGARIELVLDGRKITARGSVDTVRQPKAPPASGKPKPASPPQEGHLPAIFKSDQVAYVRADNLDYDEAGSLAVYTGNVRMWQGELTINGGSLTLDERKGDLTATGAVRSHIVLLTNNEKTKAKEKAPTIATGESLVYLDATREITVTGTQAKQARLVGAEGDLSSNRIKLLLDQAGEELERLEAEGAITLKLPENRTAYGATLAYTAADGRYVMHGAPVRIDEECRETTGRTLTFFRSTDRITADGNDVTRTQTKSGGKCSEPRLD